MNFHGEIDQPFVSIVTLNYNQAALTNAFLESAKKLLYNNYEILVCDMASEVNPETVINSSIYPHTVLLHAGTNLGFAGGNNWGIRKAKGEFVFIVNNDTELTPDILQKLILPFNENDHVGVVC